MAFNSLLFILFFVPIFIGLMYFIKDNKIRNIIIILFSLLFYAANDINYLLLIILITLITYLTGKYVKNNKPLYLTYVILIILLLAFFKYGNKISILSIDNIIMPLGISFYTFTSISYVSDVYYKKIEYENNYLNLFTYLTFFITITSGPILRYKGFKDYIDNKDITTDTISIGIRRFVIGLFKKVVIANTLALGVNVAFNKGLISAPLAWFGAITYVLEMYYDFSGYSDMAIGLAYAIGFKIPENFVDPYSACTIKEFWSRWHISLSTWFKDYVYIPLGGSRVSKARWIINILIVWCLTGMWHGSTISYLLWGLWNGIFVLLEKLVLSKIKAPKFIGLIFTQFIFMMGLVIFNSSSFELLGQYIKSMFGLGTSFSFYSIERLDILYLWPYIIIGILFVVPKIKYSFYSLDKKLPIIYDLLIVCLLTISIVYILNGSYSSFIYAGF